MNKKPYFENLDGLRFFCFLSVFLFHSFYTEHIPILDSKVYIYTKWMVVANGNLGVNFFFVLSGFLITYLLLLEKNETGNIQIRKFWKRRALRIWPLYYLCVAFGFFAFPLLKTAFGQIPDESAQIINYITFTNNFSIISNGFPDSSVLSVLWSIAIEEQFYFIWPMILSLVPVRRWNIVFVLVVIGSWVFRFYHDSVIIQEIHTFSCIGDMAIGSFGAWLIVERKWLEKGARNMPKWTIGLLYLTIAIVLLFCKEIFDSTLLLRVIKRTVIAILALAVILEQNYAVNSFFKFSKFKTVSKLGIITYGLYCLHFIGILVATTLTKKFGLNTHLWQVLFLDTALALSITIVLAKISFRFYEKPFLRLKKRFDI